MNIRDIAPFVMTLAVCGIIAAVSLEILDDVEQDVDSSIASAAINNTTLGVAELTSWFETIGLVGAAAVVIGLVVYVFRRLM
jgi:CHASE3 domain sensor protein